MALNYLLSPEFQIVNTAGKPASGGFLNAYVHGSRDRYYCSSDFDGTLHPFNVPLDALGGNVVLADDSQAYDVYIYNRYGSLLMSRYNVHPSSGGSMGGVITSTDGSVTVTPTQDGYDLSVNDGKASTLRAAADPLYADGYYSFRKLEGEGESIYMDNEGHIFLEDGWYHFSATVKLSWNGVLTAQTGQIKLYSGLTYDIIDFDYSYNHVDTILLDGDIYIGARSSHYIMYGRNFALALQGMPSGMVAELVDCDIHSIIGHGTTGGVGGEKNIHRLLRYYTTSEEADEQHPAGDWLHDFDAADPNDPSRHPMVTADQLFDWYEDGQVFELYEIDGEDGQLGWSAVYRMVTWQDQSEWWSQNAEVPGRACRLEFFRMGMYSTPYRGGLVAYIRYQDEQYMRLYEILPGESIWIAEYQEKLPYYDSSWHAGDFLRVKQDGSDLEWVPLSGVALSGSYTDLTDKPTINNVPAVTSSDDDKVLKASYTGGVGSYSWETETDTTYSAGTGIDIDQNNEISVENPLPASTSADASKVLTVDSSGNPGWAAAQAPISAGNGVSITNNVVSAKVDGTSITFNSDGELEATAAAQVQSNWAETDTSDPSYIQNKPVIPVVPEMKDLVAGSGVTITEGQTRVLISATGTVYTAGTGIGIQNDVISADTTVLALKSELPVIGTVTL